MMRNKSYHKVVKSGNMYLTWLHGWSKNINNAMFVNPNIKLTGKQHLVKVSSEYIIKEIK